MFKSLFIFDLLIHYEFEEAFPSPNLSIKESMCSFISLKTFMLFFIDPAYFKLRELFYSLSNRTSRYGIPRYAR